MPRTLIATALLFLCAGAAQAQVTGPIPNTQQDTGGMDWRMVPLIVSRQRTPEEAGREIEIERKYQETLKTKIPDKRPSSRDPWRNIRPAPAAAVADRHRVQ